MEINLLPESSVDEDNKLETRKNDLLPRKISKNDPIEVSAIASVKETYCHGSFSKSVLYVVDILLK